jgi:hypothetical protein
MGGPQNKFSLHCDQYYEKKVLTVMVNHSTNIYKTNNRLKLPVHKNTTTYDVGNPGPGLES